MNILENSYGKTMGAMAVASVKSDEQIIRITDRKWLPIAQLFTSFICAIFFVRISGIFAIPFTDTTEARYAEIGRKMVETQNWVTPFYDYGIPFWGKPPLNSWMSAIGMEVFGVNEFGGRIVFFLLSLLLVYLVYRFSRNLLGKHIAIASVGILISSGLFFGAMAFVSTDLPLIFGVTLSMIAFWQATSDRQNKLVWSILFFTGLSVGMLAKGPVAIMLTGIPLGLWVLIGNRWQLLKLICWGRGIAVLLCLTVPWYALAELRTPGFLEYFIVGEHFNRFLISGWEGDLYGNAHAYSKGRIWLNWLLGFLPWTLVCLPLLFNLIAISKSFMADESGFKSYLLLWSLSPMLLFTVAANILPSYILPGIPAVSILLATLWVEHLNGDFSPLVKRFLNLFLSFILFLYIAFVALNLMVPQTLKSTKHIVSEAYKAGDDIQLNYVGKRVYSIEFYSAGTATRFTSLEDLKILNTNEQKDALILLNQDIEQLDERFLASFNAPLKFGRRSLLVEKSKWEQE